MGLLERATALEQDPLFGALARANHDRGGRRQAHGTGAGDHKHRHQADQGSHRSGLRHQEKPHAVGGRCNKDDDWNEDGRHPVGQPLNRGFTALGLLDQADDLR